MRRPGTDAPQFRAHVEQLETRQVMSADPLADALGGAVHHQADVVDSAPALEHAVVAEPDFQIDGSTQIDFDAYFDQINQAMVEAHNQTGWFNVRNNFGFTGRGQTVAVIDSGIAWDHFALGGGLGANYRVVGGWDFTEENDGNPYDDGTSGGHGTHVSGIIGGSGSSHPGVASGVDFVGLRVFNDAGSGYFSWVENALRWIHDNRNAFENPITTVNLSLGVSNWNSATIPNWATLEDEFAQLAADGIFIAVAAGNYFGSYNAPGLSYPAASPNVVPVMSTDDNGALSYYSQRLDRAIAAPGRSITSTVPDYDGNNNGIADDYAVMSGTSMASPYLAGAAVLVREAMQFVGYTGITQTTIYNHLVTTADLVYDAATQLSYKRLNLGRAIDVLMPADDYGSTAAAAYDLGAGGQTTTGAIARVGDADYFRFTAAASGTATFRVTSTAQAMTPSWQVHNATRLNTGDASELQFAVTAGQTYTVSLASAGGLGHYTFTMNGGSGGNSGGGSGGGGGAFTFTDWGAIDSSQRNDLVVNGETWRRITATRDGHLTVQGRVAGANNVRFDLYDANQVRLASGVNWADQARVDLAVTAGTDYFLRISGASSDVDVTLLNLLRKTGTTLEISGSAGADAYVAYAGAYPMIVVNGIPYDFGRGAITQYRFDGGAGADSITVYGSTGADNATFRPAGLEFSNSAVAVTAESVEATTVYGAGGIDIATVFDSAGADLLVARQTYTTMAGTGYSHYLGGFTNIYGVATAGGVDTAELYDSTGNDVFTGLPATSTLAGPGYFRLMYNFENVYAHSTAGGVDSAALYDSPSDDQLVMRSDYSSLRNATTFNVARGFEQVTAYSVNGGRDAASMYDANSRDQFVRQPTYSTMRGSNYFNRAERFATVQAYSSTGAVRAAGIGGQSVAELLNLPSLPAARPAPAALVAAWTGGPAGRRNGGAADPAPAVDAALAVAASPVATTLQTPAAPRVASVETIAQVAAELADAVTPGVDACDVDGAFASI